uniref:CTP synthase n=1 Tax=Ananas comosus var. bracteatus TaxID=296719 RepID=A0A6V7Q2D0_ANACO|nr:unnamed protein product [Ananas comosus var. bracteatus]
MGTPFVDYPYLNTDAGIVSPFEHGEVFVLDDGGEVDLDLGNYERFLDLKLTCDNNITTGKIYQSVINKERKGDYLGKTVQVVPHIIDAIQEWIERVVMVPVDGKEGPADVCVIELGGTIGDIESRPFIEALSQFSYRVGPQNFCLVHVSLVPVLSVVGPECARSCFKNSEALGTPNLYEKAWNLLMGSDGVLVPRGFGEPGVQGKILAAKYARENNVPFLGICLGMQIAVIEFALSVLNLKDANSIEFDPETKKLFIDVENVRNN